MPRPATVPTTTTPMVTAARAHAPGTLAGLVGLACLVLPLAGCGSSPDAGSTPTARASASGSPTPAVEPHPTGSVARDCRRVMQALPATVDGLARGRVTPFTAQWGNPPTTLRCGVPRPAALTTSSECMEVNGVGWFSQQRGNVYTFTTIGRAGYLEVRVSPLTMPPSNALVDLTAAARQLPERQPCV